MFKDGDEFETAAGRFVIRDSVPVKAEPKRGPLGGELKPVEQMKPGEIGYTQITFVSDDGPEYGDVHVKVNTNKSQSKMIKGSLVETNVPPRLSGERMTAGEAEQVPGMLGRWVAVKVGKNDKSKGPLGV